MSATPTLEVGSRPLVEVLAWLRTTLAERAVAPGAIAAALVVPDPDEGSELWPGAERRDGAPQRGWRAWVDLAMGLGCAIGTPVPLGDGRVRVPFRLLGGEAPWHADGAGGLVDAPERYAAPDGFAAVRKLEDPGFLLPLLEALERVRPPDGGRALVLGCHRGDEVAALGWLEPAPRDLEVVGVDHAAAPLVEARARFPGATFLEADVGALPTDLGRFDLVVAIAVLQSRGVDDRALVRRLVQEHLAPDGALLLGVPASRFRAFDVVWGSRTRNFRAPDLSLAVQDLAAYRRYLHQHRFRTHVGGRYDLLLSAWRRGAPRAR
ncbi:MAG: class I SAM-dependent methyltransferase [Trueperaceae bacterium]